MPPFICTLYWMWWKLTVEPHGCLFRSKAVSTFDLPVPLLSISSTIAMLMWLALSIILCGKHPVCEKMLIWLKHLSLTCVQVVSRETISPSLASLTIVWKRGNLGRYINKSKATILYQLDYCRASKYSENAIDNHQIFAIQSQIIFTRFCLLFYFKLSMTNMLS